jgi:hypothetical protein
MEGVDLYLEVGADFISDMTIISYMTSISDMTVISD